MNRTPVSSSNIKSVGFDKGTLQVEFSNGRIYNYTGPKVAEHHAALMKAESKGRYFTQHIRHCKDTTCKLHEEAAPS